MAVYNLGSVIGPQGEKGNKGDKGDKGDPGAAATIAEVNSSTGTPFTGIVSANDGHLINRTFASEIISGSLGIEQVPSVRAVYNYPGALVNDRICNTRTSVGGARASNQVQITCTESLAIYRSIIALFSPTTNGTSGLTQIVTSYTGLGNTPCFPVVWYTTSGSGSSYTATIQNGLIRLGRGSANNILNVVEVVGVPNMELVSVYGVR